MNKSDQKYARIQTRASESDALKQNILIVDDHRESLRLLSHVLSNLGYKVRPTQDGKLALKFARATPPDLILLDIMMPGMDGYQVCEQLKACPKTKDIPVIFISSLNEVFDKVKAFSLGAVDYISKPFNTEEVVARIENQLLLRRLYQQILAQNALLEAEIEKRKRVEAELRESQHWLSAVIKMNPNVLYIYDVMERRILYINRELYRDLGYSLAEIQQMGAAFLPNLIHPDDLPAFSEHISRIETAQNGESFEFEYQIQHKNGEYRWFVSLDTVFARTAEGKPWKILGTHTDISDRKQAEAALQFSEQREREKAQQLEQTLEHLKKAQSQLIQSEKMSSIGQMVAGVAHEINNPVSFIYGNIIPATQYARDLVKLIELYQQHYPEPVPEIAEELAEVDVDFIAEDFPKIMASMQGGANRIKQIVLSLRNFSRLDEKDIKLTDIHEGLESTLVILQHRFHSQEKGREIQVIKNYGELPKVECYPAQLNQVFMNLLLNSIDAVEESLVISHSSLANNISTVTNDAGQMFEKNPQIRISTEINRDNQVVVRIADNGLGISPDVQSRMFDPFFTTKPIGRGTGLGLSISYQIVKDTHGGKLGCNSEVGRGTEFAIELPISQKVKVKS